MRSLRTFIAVEMPSEIRDRAADLIGRLSAADVDVRWVDPTNMHLTLKFLGDVPENDIPAVCEAVAAAATKVNPFSIQVRGAGAFPGPSRPRTLWIGLANGLDEMAALHKAIDSALAKLRFPKEGRKYHPHLTLGRVKRGGRGSAQLAESIEKNADFDAGSAPVAEAVVFASELTRQGPVYTVLGRAPLG